MTDIIKFLPGYVGSKLKWVDKLSHLKGKTFIELFAGSAMLSANLAKKAILNDHDIYVYKILKYFDKQIVPETFTEQDYFEKRKRPDWWRFAYCLQKMSFSNVFRYGPNGYNVPINKRVKSISIRNEYIKALEKWSNLGPVVTCRHFADFKPEIFKDKVVISDPPYEGSKAAYNGLFDYEEYWNFIYSIIKIADTVVIFDRERNIQQRLPGVSYQTRNMCVNGKYDGDVEAMCVFSFKDQLCTGNEGEKLFASVYKEKLTKLSPPGPDFRTSKGDFLELKTDTYDMSSTPNFFIERFSNAKYQTPGGPWKAQENGCKYFAYMFIKNKIWFLFEVDKLIEILDKIVKEKQLKLEEIKNKGWITQGYKIKRKDLSSIYKKCKIGA